MCYRNIKVNQTKSNMVLCFSWGTLSTFKYSCWFSCSCTPPRTVVETSDLLQHSFFSRALVLTLGLNQEEQSTERQAGQLFVLHSCVSLMCCIIKSKCFWLISCCCFFTVIIWNMFMHVFALQFFCKVFTFWLKVREIYHMTALFCLISLFCLLCLPYSSLINWFNLQVLRLQKHHGFFIDSVSDNFIEILQQPPQLHQRH